MASVLQAPSSVDPVSVVLDGFGVRRSRVDYAFFKFNLPERGMGMLIDFIVRRRRRQAQIRASLYLPDGGGSVYHADFPFSAVRHDARNSISIGDAWLGPTGSQGAIGPISWDLVFQPTATVIDPLTLGRLQPFDLRLRSVPDVLMSGSASVARHGYSFSHEQGMVGSYHGRRLPDHWYWVSASAFEQPGVSLECMLLDSSIFGLPFTRASVGYFHLRTPDTNMTLTHPLNGKLRISGSRNDLHVVARQRHGDEVTVHCKAAESSFHHLGDRLHTTLLGECIIDGLATADGTAGVAEREWQHSPLAGAGATSPAGLSASERA